MADTSNHTVLAAVTNTDEDERHSEVIDFKMVTFSLGGKDYGIDIMNVKEISKVDTFTYVPNTAPFVRGVYNLRGEIISIIDLRIMFNIPAAERPDQEPDDIIFLRFEDHLIGVIVDEINDVVGVSKARIQPPHPLFGDINIKFIDGVVEHDDRLFIVLDTDMVFGHEMAQTEPPPLTSTGQTIRRGPNREIRTTEEAPPQVTPDASPTNTEDLSLSFLRETLATFRNFIISPVNEEWVRKRIREWSAERGPSDEPVQIGSEAEADEFLAGFLSNYTDRLWGAEYSQQVGAGMADAGGNVLTVWDAGCGQGYEAYSIACMLRTTFPESRIKIWAHDNDLLKISTAPNLILEIDDVPDLFKPFTVEGSRGWTFADEIKDLILFEYHDVRHENAFPPVNIVFARDILSYLQDQEREKLLDDMHDLLTPGGVLVIGDRESLRDDRWAVDHRAGHTFYVRR